MNSIVASIGLVTMLFSCSAIDDDLSDCDKEEQFQMEYQLRLVTNMTTELTTQLTTTAETKVASALQTHLKDIFSDFAHDVDLSFYDTEGDLARLQHDRHIMDANQTTYDLTLPMHQYLHLAVANVVNNVEVALVDDDNSPTAALRQRSGTTIASHTTGLFTARQPMEVLSDVDQTFNVRLYMANSAASLVIDPKRQSYTDLKVYATGFASDFLISDSVYVFPDTPPLVKAEQVATGNDLLCFCSVNFPSRDAAPATARRHAGAVAPLWQFKVYLTKPDGTVTETILDINEPLKAGDLKVIKGELDGDGAVRPTGSTVGVSVTLDWKNGGEYDTPL